MDVACNAEVPNFRAYVEEVHYQFTRAAVDVELTNVTPARPTPLSVSS